jgi:hypothetical protein
MSVNQVIYANNLRSFAATTLTVGNTNATKVELGKTTVITETKGPINALEGGTITGTLNTDDIACSSYIQLDDMAAPANGLDGTGRLYKKTGDNGLWYKPDSAGVEVNLALDGDIVNKRNASAAPTANDDSANTSGNGLFAVGSEWIDVAVGKVYNCVDATITAAIWKLISLDTTDNLSEGATNKYYTEVRVAANTDVATNTTHRGLTTNPHSVTKAQIGLTDVINIKDNNTAIAPPTVTDDSNSDYSVGSIWTDATNQLSYICTNASVGAATWKPMLITDTDEVPEGAVNLYYTDVRADARITLQKGAINGIAELDATGKVPSSQINVDSLTYLGGWDANTNTPTIVSGVGTSSEYYIVTTSGTTTIDGISDWQLNDWVIFNGVVWEKIDQSESVISVAGKIGIVTIQLADITDLATTTDLPEGTNLYYTETRVNANTNVSLNTTHRGQTTNPHSVTKAQVGLTNVADVLSKYDATAAPTANDDSVNTSTNGIFTVGSLWFDVTNDLTYSCLDATSTAAVWKLMTITDTDDIPEGITNLYYTDVRADARITAQKAVANGLATLDGSGKVPASQLDISSTAFLGTWDANTNTPTLSDGSGTSGDYYIVDVAGSTTIDGISSWVIGDQIISNSTAWNKIPNTGGVTSVAGKTGIVTLDLADITDLTDTDDLPEGAVNLYYTEPRVAANTNVALNTTHRGLTNNPHSVTKAQVGLTNLVDIFSKYDATAPPTANDDSINTSTNGTFTIGSLWIDVTNDQVYACLDATPTAAVWNNMSSGAGPNEANTASSLGGTGVYKTKVGVDLQFKGITASTNLIAITSNVNDIGIDVNTVNILGTGALDSGSITSGFGNIDIGTNSFTTTGSGSSLGALTMAGAATSVITFDNTTTNNQIVIPDNLADAFRITDGTNDYLRCVSTTASDQVDLLQNTTVAGNLIVSNFVQVGLLTTAARNALTPANGFVIYNTDTNKMEHYENSRWVDSTSNYNRTVVNTNTYTVLTTDDIVAVQYTNSGTCTITLPAASGLYKEVTIVDEDGNAGNNAITIIPTGGDTILGDTAILIDQHYNTLTMISDASSKWFVK